MEAAASFEAILKKINSVDVNVNEIVTDISSLWENSASKTFKVKKSYVNKNSKQKRWFNDKCKQQRVTYVNSKNFYRRSKTTQNFQNMKECSKKYKLEMRKARKEMQKNFEQKLRGLKSSHTLKCKLITTRVLFLS